jgi:hypothetical protein
MNPEQAAAITRAFELHLERCTHPSGFVADESELPHRKAQVDAALLASLRSAQDAEARGRLKSAYLRLAQWQPGVGEVLARAQIHMRSSAPLHAREIEQLAARFRKLLEWQRLVASERSARADNLSALGFGLCGTSGSHAPPAG